MTGSANRTRSTGMRRTARIATVLVAVGLLMAMIVTASGPETPPLAPTRSFALGLSPGAGILDLEPEELERDLDIMAELGLSRLRLDFDWSRIEWSPGRYDWEQTDRIVDHANRRGITVHGLLAYTPDWARPAGTSDKRPPTDPALFADFAATTAARYQPMGVTSWEIWNEPNVEQFWEPEADPEAYARLFTAAVEAIRSADADAVVVTGGLAPARDRGEDLSAETFLHRMFDTLEPGLVDAVAVHPYSHPTRPSNRSKAWNLFGRLPAVRDIVAEAAGRPVPLWLTEFGAPTGTAEQAVSNSEQAAIVVEALQCAGRLDWVEALYLYNLRDRSGGAPDEAEDNFGLFAADGEPKEAAEALAGFGDVEPGDLVPSPCEGW